MSASLLPSRPTNEEGPGQINEEYQRGAARSPKTAVIAGAILLALLLAAGVIPRLKRRAELSAVAGEQQPAMTLVSVVKPHQTDAASELILPATTQAIQETIISARTGGYVRR